MREVAKILGPETYIDWSAARSGSGAVSETQQASGQNFLELRANKGACRGVDDDLFFPERGDSTEEAKAVCAGCFLTEQCLEYALENGEKFGIWGGMSERERRRIRRARAIARRGIVEVE